MRKKKSYSNDKYASVIYVRLIKLKHLNSDRAQKILTFWSFWWHLEVIRIVPRL